MKSINSNLYSYVADIITLPMIQEIIESAGGIITSTGLIWPVDLEDGTTVYFDINIISSETYLLPYLDSDHTEATEITDKHQILKLQNHIEDFIYTVSQLVRFFQSQKDAISICLAQTPKNIPFFIHTSPS